MAYTKSENGCDQFQKGQQQISITRECCKCCFGSHMYIDCTHILICPTRYFLLSDQFANGGRAAEFCGGWCREVTSFAPVLLWETFVCSGVWAIVVRLVQVNRLDSCYWTHHSLDPKCQRKSGLSQFMQMRAVCPQPWKKPESFPAWRICCAAGDVPV